MSYTALYRKFRPDNFADVKGQAHITDTLRNQIKAGRIGHAYLFCGTRGTGKTTVAKIFARAVNCEAPVDGSPCGQCAACRGIQTRTYMNVIEIDAASNNGVDNIREIRDEVAYSPTEGRYKVYIIDEVHMLSIGAFNALLKTLEEPPEYVIFILATTEAHKIPVTILSRCQRYDFRRITMDTITERLKELMLEEGQEAEEKALRYVAKAADGSMRDALSLLDQCIAFYLGQKLTYDNVLEVLGAVDTEVFSELLLEIAEQDVGKIIRLLDELVMQGRELSQFVTDFTWYLRNLLLLKGSDKMEDVLDYSTEQLERLKTVAARFDGEALIRYIRIFSDLSNQIKYSSQKRILIEMALIKLCRPQMETDYSSLVERLNRLEEQFERGVVKAAVPEQALIREEDAAAPLQKRVLPEAIPEDVEQVVKNWNNILAKAPGSIKIFLKKAGMTLGGDNRLELIFEDSLAEDYIKKEEHKRDVEELIAQQIGKKVEITTRINDTGRPFEDSFVDIQKLVHMDIDIE